MDFEREDMAMMEVDYPPEEEMRRRKTAILAAMPERAGIWDEIRRIYWEPGFGVVFYQCGSAWLVTGLVYMLLLAGCVLTREDVRARTFFALMACPLLYLVFSFVSLWTGEQEAVAELKRTLHYSFDRIVALRMFYSGLIMIGMDLLLLPAMGNCSLGEAWAAGAAGVSGAFLFAMLSLYLYRRIGGCGHMGIMAAVWTVLGAGAARYGDVLYGALFQELPAAVHIITAVCCMAGFADYIRRVEKNAYA